MCKYKDICPVYDECSERCDGYHELLAIRHCVPGLLEAYHSEKGTDYNEIKEYLN